MAQKINVNTTPGQFMPTLYYSQGDIGREFEIVLASSDGWSIPAGATVTMVATKPSGFGFSVAGTLTDNVASFTTTETMTNEHGRYPAEIRITSNGDVIGTANFYLSGEKDPHPEGTTDGDAETIIPELTLLVERVEAAASSVLDMTVVANTLPAGSDATYSYDEETNTATFGIPKGADGSLASGVLAPTYSSSSTYAVGDYVYYSGNLYRCTTAITTAEAWTSGHWTQVAIAPEVSDVKSALSDVWNTTTLNKTGGGGTVFSFEVIVGKTYIITNESSVSGVGLRTCTSDGTEIESIKNGIAANERLTFTATANASYIRIYSASSVTISIKINGYILDGIQSEIDDVSNSVAELTDAVGGYISQYEDVECENTNGYYIDRYGTITSTTTKYNLDKATVVAGDTYKVSASSNFSNPYWVWLDGNDDVVSIGDLSGGDSTITSITDKEIVAPTNAVSILINWNSSGEDGKLKHFTGEKIAGKWHGKKWVCVGDSLTAVNQYTQKHYFDYVADVTDIEIVNMGVSGTGYRGSNPFYSRVLNVPVDADVVTIFGSFNDGVQNIGTADDTGTTTIGGCINTTLDNLYSVLPTVRLGIVSPTPWDSANAYNHPWANAYVELLEAICKKRSIPFLNLYYESNLRPWNADFRTLCYSNDNGYGVHPNDTGHAIIAPRFKGFLETLLL